MVSNKVYVVGVGMTKFAKSGTNKQLDYPEMAAEAVNKALEDARIDYKQIQYASVGYVLGDSCCGQKALYQLGLTGIPIVNVNNNCATGSSALYLTKCMIEGGLFQCALALGFEKMEKGSLTTKFKDRVTPIQDHVNLLYELHGLSPTPITAQLFGAAGKEHMEKYGTKEEHFAKIACKNHKHSKNNPNAQLQQEHDLKEVVEGPKVRWFCE